jgi:hypothetical protein
MYYLLSLKVRNFLQNFLKTINFHGKSKIRFLMKGLPWIFVRTYSVTVHNSTKFEPFISYQKEIKNSLIAHSNVKATIVLLSM